MTFPFWMLIGVLAIAAFSIRVLGLFSGVAIKSSRFSWVLDDLPGLIVVSLVAASLAGQETHMWIAAIIALAIAYTSNHVIVTMCVSVAAYGGLIWFGF